MADPERFTSKDKPITYNGEFFELYRKKNNGQVHKISGIIELEKMCTLTAENPYNFDTHQIIEISLVLCSANMVSKDQNKFVLYNNNYID